MTDDRWQRLEAIFQQAADLAPERRSAFLAEACGTDDSLRREVETLLRAAELEGEETDPLERVATPRPAEPPPTLGPYRLVRELGHGGMGAVYLAERQDDEFHQRVAIKVVRSPLAGASLLTRFRAERQILADLVHPNIARLLDGGTTDDGLPYLVMEYIDGLPIDRYCDEQRLSTRQRLDLFRTVCAAVHHAHRNLVVHRDIKPGNILVTEEGTPKLLDFGIAKLLESEDRAAPDLALTATADRILTPAYASPEQIRGESLSTASDVYSLGVLLYELLTGRRPLRFPSAALQDVERVILEENAPRPSTLFSGGHTAEHPPTTEPDEKTLELVASERAAEPATLRRQLAGDLDNIVLMALRKEPERRYASVDQMAEDIRRHVSGLPVLARPDTFVYRAQKFVSRNRGGVAAAVLLVALLTAVVSFYTLRLARERDRARLEARKASRIAELLTDVFRVADPSESRGETVTARELLDRGRARLQTGLEGEPEVRVSMLSVISDVYSSLGLYDDARELARQVVDEREELLGEEHPDTASGLAQLGSLEVGLGNLDRAEGLLRRALAIHRATLGPRHREIVRSLNRLGSLLLNRGSFDEAQELLEEAKAMAPEVLAAEDSLFSSLDNNLGRLHHLKGDYAAAEPILRRALEHRRRVYGGDHPMVDASLNNLATLLEDEGDLEGAEELIDEALEMSRRLYGERSHHVATRLNNLSSLYKKQLRYAEAEELLRQAYDIYREHFGEQHPRIAMCLNNLANLRHDQGDYTTALELHRRALALGRELYGDVHTEIGGSLNNLAMLMMEMGNLEEAERYQQQALEVDRKAVGDEHPYVAADHDNLANVYLEQGRLELAESSFRRSLELRGRVLGEESPVTAQSASGLGRVLLESGRLEEAESLLRGVLETLERSGQEDHWLVPITESRLGECLALAGRYAEAEPLLLRSHPRIVELGPRQARKAEHARRRLVELYEAWDKPQRAARYRSDGAADVPPSS